MPRSIKQVLLVALAMSTSILLMCDRRGDRGWEKVVKYTDIKVPQGGAASTVAHPTEVVYCGTIDLKSEPNVRAFISLNKLQPMSSYVEADGLVHRGTIAYSVPKEQYSGTYILFGQSELHAWEFVLDVKSKMVRYEVLVPDMSGDLPRSASDTPSDDK